MTKKLSRRIVAAFATLLCVEASSGAPVAEQPESILPIPPEATRLQQIEFRKVIEESRKTDVSVTDESALLYHGLQLAQDEEWDEAIPFLEEALRRDPSLQSGWEGLGWAYVKIGDVSRARRLWEYFRRLMPSETLPHSLLAQAAIIDRDWAAADRHFVDAIATGGASYDVRFWYAQNLMRLGRPAEAEERMRELVAENPDRLDIQLDLASLLSQRLAYEEAVEIYRRVNDELPGNTRFMLEQALLETRVGELDRADALCLDVLEIEPDNVQAMTMRADISEIAGQGDIAPFLAIVKDTPDPKVRAALRIRLANRCQRENAVHPGTHTEDFVLGLMHDAITDDPDTIDYKIFYAERLLQAGRRAECKRIAVNVLENDNRHHARAKMILFELALRERRFEDALQILVDRYAAFDSTDPMQHYNRARLATAQGDFAGAMREIDLLEAAAANGCVLTLSYEGLTESDWTPATSVRRLHEHILSLQREGWTLISAADIPTVAGLAPGQRRGVPEAEPDVPATARFFDWIRWAITGKRRFAPKHDDPTALPKPVKCFTVTFEGDHRSALILGTSVAEEFGVPFTLFTQTEPADQYVPSRAGWQELREAAKSGAWIVGTQLHGTYLDKPVDADGKTLRHSLPNRVWVPSRNRRESMNEWDRRMRDEFRVSASILHSEMGTNDCPVTMVSYPWGDIGQSGPCNLSVLRNPAQSILSEAAREYQLGFLPSDGGFTVSGDNLLLCRRWLPPWSAEGADVVLHAYENHPAFLARRMRVELAMLTNRPNLAVRTLEALRRDGYPEDLCRELDKEVQARFRNKPRHGMRPLLAPGDQIHNSAGDEDQSEAAAPSAAHWGPSASASAPSSAPADADAIAEREQTISAHQVTATLTETMPDPLWEPGAPRISVFAGHAKANDQVESGQFGVGAGLDLNRNSTLDFEAAGATLKQTVKPHWNAVTATNVPYADSKYKFKMSTTQVRGNFAHRTTGGATIAAALGWSSRSPKGLRAAYANLQDEIDAGQFTRPDSDSTWLLALSARWYPRDNLAITVGYDHDWVLSAVRNIEYHSALASADWLPEDGWKIGAGARYWTYDDDNAMYSGRFESFWETNPDLGVWLGLSLSTTSTSDPCDFYWTPYWDQRIMGVLRYEQSWEGYAFRLDLLGGFSRSHGRDDRAFSYKEPEEKVVYVDGVANTVVEEKDATYVLTDKDSSWDLAWGVNGQWEKATGRNSSLLVSGSVTALHEYIDHSFSVNFSLKW